MTMKEYLLLILFFVFIETLFSQRIEGVVLSEDGISVSYASVQLKNRKIGIVSDSAGHFTLPISMLMELDDTLLFSCLGFWSKTISVSNFKKNISKKQINIVLKANSILLNEISITPSNRQTEYGFYDLKSSNVFLNGQPLSKVLVFIENTDGIGGIIKSVNMRLYRKNDKTKKLRVFFCEKATDNFQVIDFSQEDIIVSDLSKSDTKIDVSKYNIPFTAHGISVGVEWISVEGEKQNLSEKIGLSLVCTANAKQQYTWIFQEGKWGLFPLLTEDELNKMSSSIKNKLLKSNAQIGITVY